jgi:hypothetical protein
VAVGVGAGAQRGVAGGGLGVGIVVVTIFEKCAVIQKEAKAPPFEIGAVPVEVVGAKLIDHQDDDQPGMRIVGAGPGEWRSGKHQQSYEQPADTALELGHGNPD